MAMSIRNSIRRRRMQRWLRREALLLAREAERFGCDDMIREADQLLEVTGSVGRVWVLRTA